MYITAFASISSNRNQGSFDLEELLPSKWYRCGRENPVSCRTKSHVFAGEEFRKQVKAVQIPMTKADSFLRIFEAIPGILKRSETL